MMSDQDLDAKPVYCKNFLFQTIKCSLLIVFHTTIPLFLSQFSLALLLHYFPIPHGLQKLLFSTSPSSVDLVINAVGMDRLGIVSDVTGLVIDAGGNVGDSQAAKLGSHFGLMMEVTLPRDKLDSLKAKLEAMPDMNAAVYEDPVSDASATPQIGCKF